MTSFAPPYCHLAGYVAGGNISPSRIVTPSTTVGNTCSQASASTQLLIGISGKNTRYNPGSPADDGYHAIAGESVTIHGPGQICSLLLGSTAVTDLTIPLTSDGSGKGLPQAPANGTTAYYVALPLVTGAASETIDVIVLPPTITV